MELSQNETDMPLPGNVYSKTNQVILQQGNETLIGSVL